MIRRTLRVPSSLRRALGAALAGVGLMFTMTGCPSTPGLRGDRPLSILGLEKTTRPATVLETAIWSASEGVEVTMDVVRVELEIGGAPPGFVVVTLYDETGEPRHRQRFDQVRLGRQTLEVELVDPRGLRPPPGIYRLVIVPYCRDGLPTGGDERTIHLVDPSA